MSVDISARTEVGNRAALAAVKKIVAQLGWGTITHVLPIDGAPKQGSDAFVYRDEDGAEIAVPARGRPDRLYFRVRSVSRSLDDVMRIDFSRFGVEVNTPEIIRECDEVLGVWT
ncbi:MAG: hypothetical protein AAFX39_12605 [Pseudomonadota bacterium]